MSDENGEFPLAVRYEDFIREIEKIRLAHIPIRYELKERVTK